MKLEDARKIIHEDISVELFCMKIWKFYNSERMFILKTLKHLLEFFKNENSQFHTGYATFLKDHTILLHTEVYSKQLSYLMEEIQIECIDHLHFDELVNRNIREQLETLDLILLAVHHSPISFDDMKNLMALFRQHDYGMLHFYDQTTNVVNQEILKQIQYTEYGIVLLCLMPHWYIFKDLYKQFNLTHIF